MRISDWSSDVCSSDLGNGEPENDGVSMVKFDMGAAWDDAMTLVRAHLPLTGVLAGLFFFLPGVAAALLGPAPLAPPDNATPDQISALLWEQDRKSTRLNSSH